MPERNVDTGFWRHPKVRSLSRDARALLVYLMTGPNSHALGIYALPMRDITYDNRMDEAEVLRAMAELSRSGHAHYDLDREVVWVVKMGVRQARSWAVWRGVKKQVESLYKSPLGLAFVERYQDRTFTISGEERVPLNQWRPVTEPLPKGCSTVAEWLANHCSTLDEGLPKGSRVQQGFGNPPGTGTGTGTRSRTSSRERSLDELYVRDSETESAPALPERKPQPQQAYALADHLRELILRHLPEYRHLQPGPWTRNREQWANAIRLMNERDARGWTHIREVMEWAQDDTFWRTNILSAIKLREKFDQLVAQMRRSETRSTATRAGSQTVPHSPDLNA